MQSGRDLFLRDRTGSGKTFGMAIVLASRLASAAEENTNNSIRSLYVVPNHELAVQISDWIQILHGSSSPLIQSTTMLASKSSVMQSSIIPHTLIGTPARLVDCIGRIPTHLLDCIIIEEADQALRLPTRYAPLKKQKKRAANPKPTQILVDQLLSQSQGRKPQLAAISATLNRPLRHWMRTHGWVHDPAFIDITQNVDAMNHHTKHHCLLVSPGAVRNIGSIYEDDEDEDEWISQEEQQQNSLLESIAVLLDIESVHNGILFVDSSVSTTTVTRQLRGFGIDALDIRGYNDWKSQRNNDIDDQKPPLWVATEFSARGMDIPNVSHVFILGEPSSIASYVHMAGRTGRLGKDGFNNGKVITIVQDKSRAEDRMWNMYRLMKANVDHYQYVQ
ncbi:P-loop containing nucleoside triphosphate hydrolase protein [Lichtheimia hyalospora FSU 10163]|nr:P-loop containing nucleoside triphosphate hydrolase protein [Lichtheimia hyalospora FSU 10163]